MTKQPWSVRADDSVGVARQMLAQREIRHLPVVDADQVVGMITERDLARAADRSEATAEDIMMRAHCVDEGTPLEDVLDDMESHHRDAVVVTSDGQIRGIFTAMDALHVLRELLRRRAA